MTRSLFPTQFFQLPSAQRRLAYSEVGERGSPDVLLCLPGLLETRATFDPVLQAAKHLHGLRVISLDMCGRGDADPYPHDKGYAMSVYLEDVLAFLKHEVNHDAAAMPRVHVLGTSMGGILAMYVASDKSHGIQSLTLNDIGLSLKWLSIYGLYDSMKQAGRMPEPHELAEQLQVTIGAVLAVQSPAHFDLPYRKDWTGMKFGHLLSHFKGRVRLVHGGASGVCLPEQVREMQSAIPQLEVLEVPDAKHPAPFNAAVCHFVLKGLGAHKVHAPSVPPVVMQTQLAFEDALVRHDTPLSKDKPVSEAANPSANTPETQPMPASLPNKRWWQKLMRRLNATEK
jgi:pimeloyl-ACP methyl ester carboxylesterase